MNEKYTAVISTSGNPFHYGHYDLYKRSEKIFSNVAVLLAQNADKDNVDVNRLKEILQPYNMNVLVLPKGIALARFLSDQNIKYNIRGIRNAVDAEYELKLDFFNKEINPILETVFLPTSDTFSNISSSTIKQLNDLREDSLVKKYMNEDSYYRWTTESDNIIIRTFFGKSCVGKSTYLKKHNINAFDVDKEFGRFFNVSEEDKQLMKNELNRPVIFYQYVVDHFKTKVTDKMWYSFFDHLFNNYKSFNNNQNMFVYNLDWAAIWMYWDFIPTKYKGYFRFIELTTSDEDRFANGVDKEFITPAQNKLEQLDVIYDWMCQPRFVDDTIKLTRT